MNLSYQGLARRIGLLAVLLTACTGAAAQGLQALAAQAAQGVPVVWYESSPENQISAVLQAFNSRYPDIKVNHVRLVGGNEVASRTIQEVQARGYTADLLTSGPDHLYLLNERGLLRDLSGDGLGLSATLSPVNYAVTTAASVYVLLWNTRNVTTAQVPDNWEALLDDKWRGRVGSWVRAAAFMQLASVWGEDKARAQLEKFVTLQPHLFKSTFPLAQGVAAGEVDVAIGFYHTTQPVLDAGAPVQYRMLDPTPMHTISSAVTRSARNPAGALLLLHWLTTDEGAQAYEQATSRGNPAVPTTKTYAMLQGVQTAEWPFAQVEISSNLNEQYNAILARSR